MTRSDTDSLLVQRLRADAIHWRNQRDVMSDDRDKWMSRADEAQAKVRELHKALSEGYGVEDGGIWEDRALSAESERDALASAIQTFLDTDPITGQSIDALAESLERAGVPPSAVDSEAAPLFPQSSRTDQGAASRTSSHDSADPHREGLEATIRYLAERHHDTIRNSKRHDPEARTWEQCDCKPCVRAQEALGISRTDRAAERFLNVLHGEEDSGSPTEESEK